MKGLVSLSAAESQALSDITIVGMRFYPSSFDTLIKSAKIPDRSQRLLFIVPEVGNDQDVNAIMLSNGVRKIGSIAAAEAPAVKALFEAWRVARGYDEAIVVDFARQPLVNTTWEVDNFKRLGSFKVKGTHRVHERLARKFAAKFNI